MHPGDKPASRRIGGLDLLMPGGGQLAPQRFNGRAEFNEDVVGQGALRGPERQGLEGVPEHVQRPRLPVLRKIIGSKLGRPLQGLDEAHIEALVVHPAPAHHAGQAITEGLVRRHGIGRETALKGLRA
jgi:hypothetical protein